MFGKLSALLLISLAAHAQETRSMITGHVSDATAWHLAGAKVLVTNTSTNVFTELKTNDSGYYEAPLLVSGVYKVMVEAPGFKKSERPAFTLPIASHLEVNFTLEVGSVSDTLTV